ncbi:MAG: HAD-IA family hydrolase [Candidatus Faecousia sp.]|nr:HAD-IA family hydrolase [Candidatus Faecousia sp.]
MRIGILWDLDGTLLDTLQDLADGTNHALRQFGYPERTVEEVRRFVGNGAQRLIEQAIPAGADVAEVLEAFYAYYNAHCRVKTKPYDGILDALAELERRFPMAVVSNKPDTAVKRLCAQYFSGLYARGESADCPRKPAPDMVYKAMDAVGVETCIYVGDSEVDVATARNAGVPCLSVLWGFRDRRTLLNAGADHFCAACEELPGVISKMAGEIIGK